jgi:hypothetical protein
MVWKSARRIAAADGHAHAAIPGLAYELRYEMRFPGTRLALDKNAAAAFAGRDLPQER